jgi:O-antigen/teichoic acid export membrane protein
MINSISGACTRILRATVLVWMYHYLLRRISQDEFASYAVATAMMIVAPLYSSLFTSGISRYVVEACARSEPERTTKIVSSIFPLLVGAGTLFALAGCWFAWHVDAFLTVPSAHVGDVQLMIALLVLDFVVQMIASPFAAGFHVRQKYLLLNAIELGVEVFRNALIFVLLVGVEPRVIWIVVASVAANGLKVALTTAVSLRLLPLQRVRRELFDWNAAVRLCSFGLWTSLNQLAGIIFIDIDIVVLNRLATASDVAVFKLGLDAYTQLNALIVATLVSILPILTSLHARGEQKRIGEGFLRGAKYILWLSSLAVVPLIIFRDTIVTLYAGPGYIAAAPVLALLLAQFPFMTASFFLAPLSAAKAQLREVCLANIGIQVVRLAICLYVVGWLRLGAFGSAATTFAIMAVAHSLILGPMTLRAAGVTGKRFAREVLARGIAPSLVGSVVWVMLRSWLAPASWAGLIAYGALGAVAYMFAIVVYGLDDRERDDLQGAMRRVGEDIEQHSRRVLAWAIG